MSKHLVGTCSLCGGPVTVPTAYLSVQPPVPRCERCGATPKKAFGPIVDMEPPRKADPYETLRGWGAEIARQRAGDAR